MRMTLLFTILLISFQIPVRNKDFLRKINSTIHSEINEEKTYYSLRNRLISMDSLDVFINSDTLFILETFDYGTRVYDVEMWDKNKHISYTYIPTNKTKGKITFEGFHMPGNHNFPDYMRNLISRWDVSTIRRLTKEYGQFIDSWPITGIRIIIDKGRITVDSTGFYYIPDPSDTTTDYDWIKKSRGRK